MRDKMLLLILGLALFTLLRIPSLIEPFWYGDEGIYAVIGHAIRDGSVLYRDIWDNKPPLLYFIYALTDGNLFWVKLLSLFVGIGTVVSFYYLSSSLFKKVSAVGVALLTFTCLFGLPILEGNIANAENFMLLPISLAAYFILFKQNHKTYFIAGILLSVALLTKIVAIFDIAALLSILFLQSRLQVKSVASSFIHLLKQNKNAYLLAGLLLFPLLIVVAYLVSGNLQYLLSSILTNNVSYVGYENHFIIPLGLVILKIGLLLSAFVAIYFLRTKLTKYEVIIFPWITFALFSVFFSDRPYTHYLLMGIIPFSLWVGYIVEKTRLSSILIMLIILMVVEIHFPLYKKNTAYYQNYLDYVFNNKSYREYIAFFDRNALRDYDLAANIKSINVKHESIYYWSDSAQMYLLTNTVPITKYIVAYHVIMNEEAMIKTIRQVSDAAPRFIVSTKDVAVPQELLRGYTLKYTLERAKIYEKSN